ncbi:MAG TPA: hypothetical protein VNB64_02200 [Solirubrobacteraceae bacterium]|nr:hypothetical protein [Solirubrobacteraceae bacterium]
MRWWPMVAVAVLAMGGTAWAGGTLITSSRQIDDGVILARDLQPGTLTATQVREGGLEARNLSAAARRELRGTRGPRGPRGFRGPAGSVPDVDYVTVQATAPPGGAATAKAPCRGARLPMSGGLRDGSGRLVLTSSYPVAARAAGRGWVVSVVNTDAAPHGFIAYAVCSRVG